MKDTKYNVEIEVLTPLAVGSGNEWMRGADYVTNGGKVYVLDIEKVLDSRIDIDVLSSLLLQGGKKCDEGLQNILGSRLKDVTKYVFDAPIESDSIKIFLRTQLYDKPLVAGSSIKGAIRSVLFKSFRKGENKESDVFGNMKDGTEFMRFIRVSDFELSKTILVNSNIFNCRTDENGTWTGGWKHAAKFTNGTFKSIGFNTVYECAVPHDKGMGTIEIAVNDFDLLVKNKGSYEEKKKLIVQNGLGSIFACVNNHTRNYLVKERAFFKNNPAQRTDEIIDNINSLLAIIPTDNSYCVMKMAAGSGFHSITGDWQYEDYDDVWDDKRNRKGKKSRKIVEYDNNLQLMGFVKICMLSDREYEGKKCIANKEHNEKLEALQLFSKQKIEARRIADEQKEAKRKKLQLQEEYNCILLQIDSLLSHGLWEDAKKKAEEAVRLDVDDKSKAEKIIADCNRNIASLAYVKEEEKKSIEKFSQPLDELLSGISSVGNLCDTTGKWLKRNNKVFGSEEFDIVINVIRKNFSCKLDKELKKKDMKQKFVKTIGLEMTEKLFTELSK